MTYSTIVPFGFDFDPLEFLKAYRALGCASCQYYRDEEAQPTIEQALKTVEQAGMTFDSIHGVFGYHYDPSSPDKDERDRCLKVYEEEGGVAKALGSEMVVVHPSAWTPERKELPPHEAEQSARAREPHLKDFLARLAEIGERTGVTYLIENQPNNCWVGHNPVRLAEQIEDADSDRIRMCFDTGHAHITSDVCESFGECAHVVDYLHVHDNNGTEDSHLMPGMDSIPWDDFASAISEYKGPRMLEVFVPLEDVTRIAEEEGADMIAKWLGVERAPKPKQ